MDLQIQRTKTPIDTNFTYNHIWEKE